MTADEDEGHDQHHDEAEVRQHEADHTRPTMSVSTMTKSRAIRPRPSALTASTLDAENDTPERSAMDQVMATRSVTLTGVN